MDNVVWAKTAKYFSEETLTTGPNRFRHERDGIQLDAQTVIRSNFDMIYSYGVFGASEGLTVTLPEYEYLQLLQIFDENHVTLDVVYPRRTSHISPDDLTHGSHVYLFMKTQPPSYDEEGMAEMRMRQDSVITAAVSAQPYVADVRCDLRANGVVTYADEVLSPVGKDVGFTRAGNSRWNSTILGSRPQRRERASSGSTERSQSSQKWSNEIASSGHLTITSVRCSPFSSK
jgi:hypothetical protein